MVKRWQTYDKLFDMPKAPRMGGRGPKELALTPRPGEPLRWCAYDKKLVHELGKPEVRGTLSALSQAALLDLSQAPTVTLEQVSWLRRLARRVSFANANVLNGGRRAMTLTEPPSSKG